MEMILSYNMLGALYLQVCEDRLNVDLSKNNIAEHIYETSIYLINSVNDELLITNEGHNHMIYAMDALLDKIYSDKDNKKYTELLSLIPDGLRVQIKTLNNKINKSMIDDKVDPSTLFYRYSGRSVYKD